MKKERQYILFVITVLLTQILLLNHLTVSTYIAPLAYIVCIIMMPLGTSPLKMIAVGTLLGGVMDAMERFRQYDVSVAFTSM